MERIVSWRLSPVLYQPRSDASVSAYHFKGRNGFRELPRVWPPRLPCGGRSCDGPCRLRSFRWRPPDSDSSASLGIFCLSLSSESLTARSQKTILLTPRSETKPVFNVNLVPSMNDLCWECDARGVIVRLVLDSFVSEHMPGRCNASRSEDCRDLLRRQRRL
jgi:hypothetical protein